MRRRSDVVDRQFNGDEMFDGTPTGGSLDGDAVPRNKADAKL